MNRWKSNLTCSYCSKILKDPIELPCENYICREHLTDKEVLKDNKLKCLICKQNHDINEHQYKANKCFKQQLDDKLYLSNEEIALKNKIEETVHVFHEMNEQFTFGKNKLDLTVQSFYKDLRFKIDLHKEKLLKKIDAIYTEMIEETMEYEESCLKELHERLGISSHTLAEKKSIEGEFKDLEEKFRDPNLAIESIREILFEQQNKIESIQSTLDEINRITENINESVEFKPNLSFDQDSFGLLLRNEHSNDPFMSEILTNNQGFELIKLCEFDLNDRFKLIYRGSLHGFGANHFHSKCDGHANTLTILRASGTSFIFGAFTTATWESPYYDQFKLDPKSFLFSLVNEENRPLKIKINPKKRQYAIYCHSERGPVFGDGDIFITSNANLTYESYSCLGSSYQHPQYDHGTNEAYSFLTGSSHFQLSEIEVYQKEDWEEN